jgi:hypothetical protein
MWGRYVRYGLAALAVIGLALWSSAWWQVDSANPNPTFSNVKITGEGGNDGVVNLWSCVKYSIQFSKSSTPATVDVSTTVAEIYSSRNCAHGTKAGSIKVDPASLRGDFYLRSDVPGTALITATAHGAPPLSQSYTGTRSLVITWPTTVPACKWAAGMKTCKGQCLEDRELGGILYTRIPYAVEWGGQGCCPQAPGTEFYQLYGNATCVM